MTKKSLLWALFPLVLSACAPAPLTPLTPPAPAAPASGDAAARAASAAPAAEDAIAPAPYAQARAAGRSVLRIAPESLIAATVRRGGALARLGHDHVVASRAISGWAMPAAAGQPGRADFHFRLDAMSVDDATLRAQAGLDSTPSADAIAGTRNNMLTRVLDAARYPEVRVHVEQADTAPLQVDITLHGVTKRYAIPATLAAQDGAVRASGTLLLKQTDFGITPFSVLGGALAVQDQLELRFDIGAVR